METLIKTLTGENGKLYTVTDGRRILLAECPPKVNIYEKSQIIKTSGTHNSKIKSIHAGIVICTERETTRDVNIDFLQTVSHFEFTGDFQCEDGIFERITFDNLVLDEITLQDDWEFEVAGQNDIIKKLIEFQQNQ